MMMTPHLLTGAAIGTGVRRPWIALPLAFLSHFALDALPHVDPDALPGVRTQTVAAGVAVVETVLGIALVAWAVRRTRWGALPWARVAAWGAFCGVLMDLLDNVPPWNAWFKQGVATAWLSALHTRAQGDVPPAQWVFGVAAQVGVVALALGFLLYQRSLWERRSRSAVAGEAPARAGGVR